MLCLGLALGLLTGCRAEMAVEVDVHDDGSGTVTVEVGADDEVLAAEPDPLARLRLDDLRAAGWEVGEPTRGDDGLTWVRLAKPFATPEEAGAVLAEVNGPGGPLGPSTVTVERHADRVVYRFASTAALEGLDAFGDPDLAAAVGGDPVGDRLAAAGVELDDAFALEVRVRFPADVTAASALPLQGREVRWEPSLAEGAVTPLTAEAVVLDDDVDRWKTATRIGVVALAAVVLVELALLARARRRRRRAAPRA